MKFTPLLKSIILEQSKFEFLSNKYLQPKVNKAGEKLKPKLARGDFYALVNADPTTRINNVDLENMSPEDLNKVKAGKYVDWLINQFLSVKTERQPGENGYQRELENARNTFMEDLYKVTDDL